MIKRKSKLNRLKSSISRDFRTVRTFNFKPFKETSKTKVVSPSTGDYRVIGKGVLLFTSNSALGEIVNEQKKYYQNNNNLLKKRLEELQQVN